MKLLLTILLSINSICLFSQTMTPYWKTVNSHKMKYFYWDSHKNLPTRLPEKVKKEFIYHVSLDRKDSILEKEFTYNSNQQPVEIRKYAVPSKGELIQIDSLQYNNGLLVKEVKYSQAYYGGFDTAIIEYQYDNLEE